MDRSFWLNILIKHLKPETLPERILFITHSLLLDLGFIPLRHIKNEENEMEDSLNCQINSGAFEVPVFPLDKGISVELLPSTWKSNFGKYRLFYMNQIRSDKFEKVIPELMIELIHSKDSVILLIRSCLVEGTLKQEFPYQITEKYDTNETLIFELSSSIKDKIDKFFNCKTHNEIPNINTSERFKYSEKKTKPSLEINHSNQEYIGGNFFRSADPLIDDKGIRGSLVGPESIIFKNRPKVFGKPKNIPISSIPGGSTIPDNDLFFPPGNINSTYMSDFYE